MKLNQGNLNNKYLPKEQFTDMLGSKLLLGIEPRLRDSKSRVIAIRPQELDQI